MAAGPGDGRDGAVFTQSAAAHGDGRVNAVQGGDQYNYIYRGTPPYRVDPFSLDTPMTPARLARVPSRLLTARHRIVPYFPRPELQALESWRDEETSKFAVRLLHAEGGTGKTRLAFRFAESSAAAGWTTALARHRSETASAGGADASLTVRHPGLVLIVDYADRWPMEDLITLVRQHRDAARDRVRLLLLSRPAGSWWEALTHQLGKLDIDDVQPLKLEALPGDSSVRAAVYTAARDRFAEVFALPQPAWPAVPERLGDPEFALTLTVHMRALIDVDAARRGAAPPTGDSQAALSSYLLDREYDHWRSSHDQGHGPLLTDERTMGRTVYVATLTGAQVPADAAKVLVRAEVASDTALGTQVSEDHARCYPPADPALVLDPLSPDRLGEDYLALTVPGHEEEFGYYATDAWTNSAPLLLLASEPADPTTAEPRIHARPALTVLVEAAHRWPHLVASHLNPVLLRAPDLALAAGGATLSRLSALADLDPDVVEAIASRLPDRRHVDLDPGIAAVTARLTEYRAGRTTDALELADLYITLGVRYQNAGLLRQAADASRRAVDIIRPLMGIRGLRRRRHPVRHGRTVRLRGMPRAALPLLALATTNLGGQLSELRMWPQALAWTEQAVTLWNKVADRDPEIHSRHVALALHNLGDQLSHFGREQEALETTMRAVVVYRRLVEENPGEFLEEYASALNNLGIRHKRTGAAREALEVTEQSAELFRTLADRDPDAYRPRFAMALNNLGNKLSEFGRNQEAVTPAEGAARIYGELAERNPAAFLADHAMALANLGVQYARVGAVRDALRPTRRAVELYRQLAEQNPTAYRPELARALDRLGNRLSDLGRHTEAVAVGEQAAEICRAVAEPLGKVPDPDLALVLNNLGDELVEVGRAPEGATLLEEAALLMRGLADRHPEIYLPKLAAVLSNLGRHLPSAGRPQDALAPVEEAVRLRRVLAEQNPVVHGPGLARTLEILADRLADAGRFTEALHVIERSVRIHHELAERSPGGGEASAYAAAQNVLGRCLYELGRPQEAVVAFERAVDLLGPLVEQYPDGYARDLSGLLRNLSVAMEAAQELREAVAPGDVNGLLTASEKRGR